MAIYFFIAAILSGPVSPAVITSIVLSGTKSPPSFLLLASCSSFCIRIIWLATCTLSSPASCGRIFLRLVSDLLDSNFFLPLLLSKSFSISILFDTTSAETSRASSLWCQSRGAITTPLSSLYISSSDCTQCSCFRLSVPHHCNGISI